MLTSIAPKPIGRSRAGSISFFIARKIKIPPMSHITACCQVTLERVSIRNSIIISLKLLPIFISHNHLRLKIKAVGKNASLLRVFAHGLIV